MKRIINPFCITVLIVFFLAAPGCKSSKDSAAVSNKKPDKHQVIWGSSAAPFPSEKNIERIEAWKRLNDKLKSLNGGYGLLARRSYDAGIPASFAVSAMAPDVGLCPVSIGSFKPSWKETAEGTNEAAIKQFIQSVPDDHEVYLVFHHEPEDEALDGRNGRSPELLQAAFAKFVEIVVESKKTNVHPCFVLMSWTFNPKSKRNPDDFNMAAKLKPEYLSRVVAGMDGYADVPSKATAKETFEKNFSKLASWGFTRFGIFETATHSVDTQPDRASWIKGLGEWINSRKDIEIVSWFHSGVGQHAGPEGWYLGRWSANPDGSYNWTDADNSLAAYAQLLKR